MAKYLLIVMLGILSLMGCTVEVDEVSRHHTIDCVDMRSGEHFSFNTDDITNIQASFLGGTSSYNVVDSSGVSRFISSDMDAYMDCVDKNITKQGGK